MSKRHVVLALGAVVALAALAIAIPAFAAKPAEKSASAFNTVAAENTAVDITTAGGFTLRLNNPAGGVPGGGGGTNCVAQVSGDGQVGGLAFQSVNYNAPTPMNVPADSFGDTDTLSNQTGVITIGQTDNTGAAQFEFYIFDIGNTTPDACVIRGTGLGDPTG